MDLSAVILAGGKSSRMGRDKAFLEINGETLLARALKLVRGFGVEDIVISGRYEQDYSRFGYRVVYDLNPDTGPLGGIERALWQARSVLVLVLAVDLARMTEICLRRVLSRCDRLTGALGRVNGRLQPLAAIYPARCRVLVSDRLRRNQLAVHDFAEACMREGALRVVRLPRSYASSFANWNSPRDIR